MHKSLKKQQDVCKDLHLIENDWKMVHKKLFYVNRPLQ